MSGVSGTSPSQPIPPSGAASTDVPQVAAQMQAQAATLAKNLQDVVVNAHTSTTNSSFLEQFAENGKNLSVTVDLAMKMR